MAVVHPIDNKTTEHRTIYRWFPSFRFLTAMLLCLCIASNMGMAMVCMVEGDDLTVNATLTNESLNDTIEKFKFLKVEETAVRAPKMNWSPEEQGYVFSAFNVGLLLMVVTGAIADKLNAKYMIVGSILLACIANLIIAFFSPFSVYGAVVGRLLVGISDAFLQPAVNSLLTRWFPPAERSYALGLATGGRQFGTLLIVPTAGALCSQTELFGGWPSIFVVSAAIAALFVLIYLLIGADKPSKQCCMSEAELQFIMRSNIDENIGKKRTEREIEWCKIIKSAPVWAAVISVVCHEYPIITMIMFLPSYLRDVHHYTATENGFLSALPTVGLWISKILSSYLNTLLQERTKLHRTTICKLLNSVGSIGLAIFLCASTQLDSSHASLAVIFLCISMACAGLHTPGCLSSLVSVAPAFSGAITGLAFFFVAITGIVNPLITKYIVQNGSHGEWNTVFYISAVISLVPVLIFNVWGSADVQCWAKAQDVKQEKSKKDVTNKDHGNIVIISYTRTKDGDS